LDESALNTLTLTEASELIRKGDLTPLELTEACLARIQHYEPTINAFINVLAETALTEARYATKSFDRGEDWGTLHGIPIAVKDNIDVTDTTTTAGGKFFDDAVATADAEVITQLQAAGAIIIGKTNMHEFAIGVTTDNPHFGTCRNPWNAGFSPGGSSGGSAAAVISGMALGALGTDTGGSVRVPAALCNLVGLRPQKGQVSTQGVFPMSWTLDSVGPIGYTASDVALLYDAMSMSNSATQLNRSVRGLRLGVPTDDFIWMETNHQVSAAVRLAIDAMTTLGIEMTDIALSMMSEAQTAGSMIGIIEAAAVHRERFDLEPERFGEDIRARLEIGKDRSGIDYAQARQRGREWRRSLDALFEGQIDVLITPTTPVPAPEIYQMEAISSAKMLLRFTYPFALSGLPSISVPCGFTSDGLPIGLQLVALDANLLLRLAHAFQQVTDWHTKRPNLSKTLVIPEPSKLAEDEANTSLPPPADDNESGA